MVLWGITHQKGCKSKNNNLDVTDESFNIADGSSNLCNQLPDSSLSNVKFACGRTSKKSNDAISRTGFLTTSGLVIYHSGEGCVGRKIAGMCM